MQVLAKEQKLNIVKHGNITIVQIVALEMINLTVISKIVQVDQVMFTIFNI